MRHRCTHAHRHSGVPAIRRSLTENQTDRASLVPHPECGSQGHCIPGHTDHPAPNGGAAGGPRCGPGKAFSSLEAPVGMQQGPSTWGFPGPLSVSPVLGDCPGPAQRVLPVRLACPLTTRPLTSHWPRRQPAPPPRKENLALSQQLLVALKSPEQRKYRLLFPPGQRALHLLG